MSLSAGRSGIFFASDGSQGSLSAEAYALALARLWSASLTVLHVLEFPSGLDAENPVNRLYLAELMKQATQELVELKARAAGRGISAETKIVTGIPSEEVLAVATGEEPDLIVVGTRGKTGLAHVLLGSTAERIIRAAPCPVLAVRAGVQEDKGKGGPLRSSLSIERILVPIDFSDCSLDALEYGALIAQRSKASIRLFHVLEPVSYGLDFTLPHVAKRDYDQTAITKRLSDITAALTSTGLVSDFVLCGGLPADSILNAAEAPDVGLVVMGTHGRRGVSHALHGSVAEFVLRKSSCPVLTVRSPTFHRGHRPVLIRQSMPGNV